MKFGVAFRLAALGAAVGLMGMLIVYFTLHSQTEANELRFRLSVVDSESFGFADQFRGRLREVNTMRLRQAIDHSPATWEQYLKASHDLEEWLAQHSDKLATQPERDLLGQTRDAFEDYLRTVQKFHTPAQEDSQESEAQAELSIRAKSQHLSDLGQALAKAHYDSRNQLLIHANETLTHLRILILSILGFLFVFGLALAGLAYRGLVVPLRVKLVESQSLVEREKLASLGMLAAGVAHEIRNPLTAIKAALFTQQKQFVSGSPEHTDVKVVEREIVRLERIVNDFLQFARPAEPEPVVVAADAAPVGNQTVLRAQLERHRIQMTLEPSPPMLVKVDPAQMKQVLINLVQNAADSIGRRRSTSPCGRGSPASPC